jgi:hypothetical protein
MGASWLSHVTVSAADIGSTQPGESRKASDFGWSAAGTNVQRGGFGHHVRARSAPSVKRKTSGSLVHAAETRAKSGATVTAIRGDRTHTAGCADCPTERRRFPNLRVNPLRLSTPTIGVAIRVPSRSTNPRRRAKPQIFRVEVTITVPVQSPDHHKKARILANSKSIRKNITICPKSTISLEI